MKYLFLISIFIFILFNCNKDLSSINENDKHQYSTYSESSEGLICELEGLKDIYSLDESVQGRLTIMNNSDTTRYHVFAYSGPVFQYTVFDENDDQVFYIAYRTATVYDFYFEPNDTISKGFGWNQSYISTNYYSGLKVFSGKYLIIPSHVGIPIKNIGKWIEINEIGEPFSTKLYYYFSDKDSLKLDFILRNRTSKNYTYTLDNNIPIKIEYTDEMSNELILTDFPEIDYSELNIRPKSDHILYKYRISKSDSVFSEMEGSYNCKITFNCNSREISASAWILLPY